ncbi:hypothetical protein P3T20_005502 [Paraburkholderia sp. GAS206C]|uniref:hypothetical protein n=1 Tax=unclassified Paraburkholderia TaxID=2615204 RepID=UPI003D1BFD6D
MTERESEAANKVKPSGRAPGSSRIIWVIVLTLPVTIVALAITLEIFGFLLRLG